MWLVVTARLAGDGRPHIEDAALSDQLSGRFERVAAQAAGGHVDRSEALHLVAALVVVIGEHHRSCARVHARLEPRAVCRAGTDESLLQPGALEIEINRSRRLGAV